MSNSRTVFWSRRIGGQHEVPDRADVGQPLGDLLRLREIEADAHGAATELGRHLRGVLPRRGR